MRRLPRTAIVVIAVVFWQAFASTRGHPAGGHPAGGRRFDSWSPSARRDDLLVGSDFLDMYSSVRSRRYPPDVDHHDPLNGNRNRLQDKTSGNLDENLTNHRMSGLIRSRDRTRSEDDSRGIRKYTKLPQESNFDDYSLGTEKKINDAMTSDKLFGVRTAPRSSVVTSSISTSTDRISVSDVPTNSRVPVIDFNVPVLPKFSVSSSVQKITSKSRQNVIAQSTQNPTTYSDVFPSTSQDYITEEVKTSSSLDVDATPSDFAQSTTLDTHSTLYDVISTTSLPESDSTEAVEDWSTKSDDVQTAEPPEFLQPETPLQVISVRVSSSVAQTPLASRSKLNDITTDLNPTEEVETEEAAGSLVVEEQPPATSIQRSDFSVEEASPSEVTSGPHSSLPVSYQTSVTTATSGSRVQFFSKPPSYRRGLAYLRRTSTEPTSPVTSNPRRHIPLHAIPRAYIPRSSTSLPPTSGREPVSVAESIQRSVIANQDEDDADAKDRVEGARGIKGFQPAKSYRQQEKIYLQPERIYGQPEKVYGEPSRVYGEPAKVYGEPAKVYGEPAKVYGEPSKVYGEPSKVYGEPSKVYGEPAKVYGEPAKIYGEPAKVYGEPAKSYAEPEQNYEVDEAVSVGSNGRAHGVQAASSPSPAATTPSTDAQMKVFDTRQQDPNHKFGYVVDGRDYRKYRVEERTSDGFIVGEYGVVSHDGDSLRGVRYTADGTINPRLIYDTLLKFLSL